MKFKKVLSVLTCATLIFTASSPLISAAAVDEIDYTIVNPYECVDWDKWDYYKANLHTHSVASDGDLSITDMVQLYYSKGYDILAMTDHGVINHGWNKERKTNGIFNYFRKADPMSDSNYERITTGSDRNGRGMIDIKGGIEMNMAVITKTHVNGYFTEYGQGEWGKENDYRSSVAAVDKAGGFTVLNHVGDWVNSNNFPERSHWNVFISYFGNIFNDYRSCLGMEIINNTDNVTRADRALWDELLQVVIPNGRNIIAFADDDSEYVSDVGRSFEYFLLPENTEENVKQAMQVGNFFACSKFQKYTDGTPDHEGNGEVPLVKSIKVDQKENTIELKLDESRDCKSVKWIANGKIISTDTKIDLNDYEDQLGCYIRFELLGDGGVTYSQAFELKYEGREYKQIPKMPYLFQTPLGDKVSALLQTHTFGLIMFITEKLANLLGII